MSRRTGSRIKPGAQTALDTVTETITAATEHGVPMMASSLSFWLLLTIAPFALVIALTSQLLMKNGVVESLSPSAATGLAAADAAALAATSTGWSAVVSLIVVMYSAAAVFSQFALAVSRIWNEPDERGALWGLARRHLLGFLLVGVLALALLASVLVGNMLAIFVHELATLAAAVGLSTPGGAGIFLGRFAVDLLASFGLFLFAFSFLPTRRILMRYVAPGAAYTAVAFAVGQGVLSFYLASSSRVTLAGSLGSLIGVLLWIYYTSLIALYGAEFTRVDALRRERQLSSAAQPEQ